MSAKGNPFVRFTVKKYTDELTDIELIRFAMVASLPEEDPKTLPFWDEIEDLYTTNTDPPEMHDLIKEMVIRLAEERAREI